MERAITLALLSTALTGCVSTSQLGRVESPDRQACIIVTTKAEHGIWVPGPEPPQTLGRWARCQVKVKGKSIYNSGFEDVGVYSSPFDFDAAWAPDSGHVAYRSIATFRILDRQGGVYPITIPYTNSLISSFKWISAKNLLLVVKEEPPVAKPKNIRIVRLSLNSGFSERYTQDVRESGFIFHCIGYEVQEISPYSDRVAFSDGLAVCVYDDAAGKVIARVPIPATLDGVWWESENRLILDLGASSSSEQFFRFDLEHGTMEDCTGSLWLLRHRKHVSATWFKPGDDFREHTEIPWNMAHIFAGSPDERALRQWISDKLPAETRLIYHGWYGSSLNDEVWLLNCRTGFASLTQQTTNRTVLLVPTIQVHNVAAELYSMGISLEESALLRSGDSIGRPATRTRT